MIAALISDIIIIIMINHYYLLACKIFSFFCIINSVDLVRILSTRQLTLSVLIMPPKAS